MSAANERSRTSVCELAYLEFFGLPKSQRDVYYARVSDECMRSVAARVLAVQTLVVYLYLAAVLMEGTVYDRWLIRGITEVELNVLSLSVFLQLVSYDAVKRLKFDCMMVA